MADTELNLEAERALFEHAYCQKYPLTTHIRPEKFARDDSGDYIDGAVFVAWDMWQIARRPSSSVSEGEMPELPKADDKCRMCAGTGKMDSGGTTSWGEAVLVKCLCVNDELPAPPITKIAIAPAFTGVRGEGYKDGWNDCFDEFTRAASGWSAPAEDAREEVRHISINEQVEFQALLVSLMSSAQKGENLTVQSGKVQALVDYIDAQFKAARRASSTPAVPGTLDEAAAYRLWRDCELSEDAWFMQHLSDYLPVGRAPTAAEWDTAMQRVMQDRASHPLEAKAGEDT